MITKSIKPNPPNQVALVRKLRGLNRKKAASFLGHKTAVAIGYWETGFKSPNLKNALKLQFLLNARIDQLFPNLARDARDELIREGLRPEDISSQTAHQPDR